MAVANSSGNATNTSNGAFDGRAALIVGASAPEAIRLAERLAEAGIDVAVVYQGSDPSDDSARQANRMKAAVEAHGRQCLIIHEEAGRDDFPQHIMDLITARFRRLDFYFDFSQASHRRGSYASNGNGHAYTLLSHLGLMAAALNELARGASS